MNPVLVNVYRNTQLESCHRGAIVAVDGQGQRLLELGDVDALVFPRSALKPIQAIPLLESGAANHFNLSVAEIALSCASHNGESMHVEALAGWMQRLGVSAGQLACGAALPGYVPAAHEMLRQGRQPGKQHHNCSGKHTGMLTLAQFHKVPLEGYDNYQHQTQQLWMRVLEDLTGLDVAALPWDRDGCGLPALALPLAALASSFARFAQPQEHTSNRNTAMTRICEAMRLHPEMVAGTERCCTDVMRKLPDLTVKTGAEGVFVAISHSRGIGIALKIDDGATRASQAVLGAVLRKLALIDEHDYAALKMHFFPDIINSQNRVVGQVSPISL